MGNRQAKREEKDDLEIEEDSTFLEMIDEGKDIRNCFGMVEL